MATVPHTTKFLTNNKQEITWENLANGDTGQSIPCFPFADKAAHVNGTWGVAGTCDMEGSADDVSFNLVHDQNGNNAVLTSSGWCYLTEPSYSFRPNVSDGDGATLLTVRLVMGR